MTIEFKTLSALKKAPTYTIPITAQELGSTHVNPYLAENKTTTHRAHNKKAIPASADMAFFGYYKTTNGLVKLHIRINHTVITWISIIKRYT